MEIKQRLAAGQIEDPTTVFQPELFNSGECGIVTSNKPIDVSEYSYNLPITYSEHYVQEYQYTLVWNSGPLRTALLPISFELLKSWDMLVPLEGFSVLANTIGSVEDRKRTEDVIGDLRVPVYNVEQMFIRRCSDTAQFMDAWEKEQEQENSKVDKRLSFLRTLFVNPLLMLALPPSWISGSHV